MKFYKHILEIILFILSVTSVIYIFAYVTIFLFLFSFYIGMHMIWMTRYAKFVSGVM